MCVGALIEGQPLKSMVSWSGLTVYRTPYRPGLTQLHHTKIIAHVVNGWVWGLWRWRCWERDVIQHVCKGMLKHHIIVLRLTLIQILNLTVLTGIENFPVWSVL